MKYKGSGTEEKRIEQKLKLNDWLGWDASDILSFLVRFFYFAVHNRKK